MEELDVDAEEIEGHEARVGEADDGEQEEEAATVEAREEAPVEAPPRRAPAEIIFAGKRMLPPPDHNKEDEHRMRDEAEMPDEPESSNDSSLDRMFEELVGTRQRAVSLSADGAPQPEMSEESVAQGEPKDAAEQGKDKEVEKVSKMDEGAREQEEMEGDEKNEEMKVDAPHREDAGCSEKNVSENEDPSEKGEDELKQERYQEERKCKGKEKVIPPLKKKKVSRLASRMVVIREPTAAT